jgi:uncharacterized membrane protein YhaH (DUF805 family)
MGLLSLYFQPAGRISRMKFWLGWVGLLIIEGAFNLWIVTTLFGRDPLDPLTNTLTKPALQLVLLGNVIFMFPLFVLLAKRFHDRNKGAIWTLPYLAVFAAMIAALMTTEVKPDTAPAYMVGLAAAYFLVLVWTIVELGFLRGTQGQNRFGSDPLNT